MDLRHSHISTSNHRFLSELGDIQPEHGFMFQNVDKFCLNMLLAQGAVISEWSQVVPSGGLENNRLSDLMHKDMVRI